MSIRRCDDLLCCNTMRDWAFLKEEHPELFDAGEITDSRHRNLTLFFFLQGAAPIHVCTVLYRGSYLLLNGRKEIVTVLDFIYDHVPILRNEWKFPGGLPGNSEEVSIADFPKDTKGRILNIIVPQCSLKIDSEAELNLLRQYYMPFASDAI